MSYRKLNTQFEDTLIYTKDQNEITEMEIFISGKINGTATLEIDNGAGRYSKIKLKGVLQEKYSTDWYQPNCRIKYKPLSIVKGDSLILKFRMH